MKITYKEIDSIRVGDTQFDTAIRTEKDKGETLTQAVLRIYPSHNAPYYQEIVLNDWSGIRSFGNALIDLERKMTE